MGDIYHTNNSARQYTWLWFKHKERLYHRPIEQVWQRVVQPFPYQQFYQLVPYSCALPVFQCTDSQPLSVCLISLSRYWNSITPSTIRSSFCSYILKFISPDLWDIYTSRCCSQIPVDQLLLSVHWWTLSLVEGMWMPQFGHNGKGEVPPWSISTWDFQCLWIKCSHKLTGVWALTRKSSTRQATEFNTMGTENM